MSGIAGVWNIDGRPVDPAVLSRMGQTIAHRGADGERRHVAGALGFLHRHHWVTPEEVGERQPLVGRDGIALMMDGRLDNRDDLLARLRLPKTISDAACVLAAYEEDGERFVDQLNGDFSIALFDPSLRRLLLARDSIGIRPLYYFRSDRLVVFASEIKAVLAHPDVPVHPDEDGVADFMLIGQRPVDRLDRTCFTGVSALAPAHVAAATPDRFSLRQYWDFDPAPGTPLGSFGEYVELFRERFAEAIRRRVRSAYPSSVSLSGGLDSSSIFCQAETLRLAGAAVSPGTLGVSYLGEAGTDADERRYLLDIERQYDVTIARFPIEPLLGLVNGMHEQVRAIEAPFVDYMWGVTRQLHGTATNGGARTFLSGQWGDQMMFSSAYLVDLFSRLSWPQVVSHLREYARWFGADEARVLARRFPEGVVRHWLPRSWVPPAKWLRRQVRGSQRPSPWFATPFLTRALRAANGAASVGRQFRSAQGRSIYLEVRSKYHVQCMEWNNKVCALHGLDASFPFLDRDLIALMMAMPGEMQNHNGVPRSILREAMRGILPDQIRTRTWKADLSDPLNRSIGRDIEAIQRALRPGALSVRFGFLDADRLAPAVDRLSHNIGTTGCLESWELADLFGLEMWLEVFCKVMEVS